jgi:mannose-6-phosphate isomerase-like protein (cupin superfamily)
MGRRDGRRAVPREGDARRRARRRPGARRDALRRRSRGGAISPYHFHHANEELLVVFAGSPCVRTPGGVQRVPAGAVVAFPRGANGAHAVTNPGPEPARVLVVSTMHFPDIAEHVETGTLLAITGQAAGQAFAAGSAIPFSDAVLSAMQAEAEAEQDAGAAWEAAQSAP